MPNRRFEFGERVFVRPAGMHSSIRKAVAKWEGDTLVEIRYDVGLGRLFRPEELEPPTLPYWGAKQYQARGGWRRNGDWNFPITAGDELNS